MIERAHGLLDNNAKIACGRGACAIELRKRSGGSRYFARKWKDVAAWDSFSEIRALIGAIGTERISTSLVYRLQKFSDGIDAIVKSGVNTELNLEKFIERQLDRSFVAKPEVLAKKMVKIIWSQENKTQFKREDLEGLIVAAFLPEANGG